MRKRRVKEYTPDEWQAHTDAACALIQREYCTLLKFWQTCRYKPCRKARRCCGDQGPCLKRGRRTISYETLIASQEQMMAATPPTADRFERAARRYFADQFIV